MSPRTLSHRPARSRRAGDGDRSPLLWRRGSAKPTGAFSDDDLATIVNALRELTVRVRRSAPARRMKVLRPNETLLLRQVRSMPGASISELATELHTDASAVSVLVARLCRRRLLVRARAIGDARMAAIRITSNGVAALEQSPAPIALSDSAAVRSLSSEDRAALASHLMRLADAVAAPVAGRRAAGVSRRR